MPAYNAFPTPRVFLSLGDLEEYLSQYYTTPRLCNMIGWKGNKISDMDFSRIRKKRLGRRFGTSIERICTWGFLNEQ